MGWPGPSHHQRRHKCQVTEPGHSTVLRDGQSAASLSATGGQSAASLSATGQNFYGLLPRIQNEHSDLLLLLEGAAPISPSEGLPQPHSSSVACGGGPNGAQSHDFLHT